jgi:hypothetical protein
VEEEAFDETVLEWFVAIAGMPLISTPPTHLLTSTDYDPFLVMKDNNKVYGFNVALIEYIETIPTLWKTTKGEYGAERGAGVARKSSGTCCGRQLV